MAQNKYDLLLVENNENKVIRCQPWYKERLKTKYIKQKKKTDPSESLIGRNWVLIQPGLDDFRDGKPTNANMKCVVGGNKGISPVVSDSKDTLKSRLKRDNFDGNRSKLTKSQACFDKALPQQRAKRDHIEEVEFGLKQHPLALYPHLEEGMPPELFEEVVDLLDPAMNPEDVSEMDLTEDQTEASGVLPESRNALSSAADITFDNDNTSDKPVGDAKYRNPYKWVLHKDSDMSKDEKKGLKKRPTSPSQDEHIKKVTKDFCEWVTGLGGDNNNVEESTIMSLFASGYETKPALSVPIHVVELSNVPQELRIANGVMTRGNDEKSPVSSATTQHNNTANAAAEAEGYEPSWVKIKYGAWYLDPSTWKVRQADAPLEDPVEVQKREMCESKKKSDTMDAQLVPLHGARAFRQFLETKDRRKPEFMVKVSDLQDVEDGANETPAFNKSRSRSARTGSPSIYSYRVKSRATVNSSVL